MEGATEATYRSIVEHAIEGIFQTTPDGQYLLANPALAEIYGYSSVDELKNGVQEIARQLYVDPNRRTEFVRLMNQNDSVWSFESPIYRKDGSVIWISENVRVIRVMPNTPALIHKGAAAYSLGQSATDADAAIVEKIFSAVGIVFKVKEELLDVVTGLSGSGPAYVYVVVEALADAGVLMGLPRDLAQHLAAQTVSGAAEMVLQTGLHPAQLKDQVTSPGGTTIAGLEALEAAGIRSAFLSAVRAATERSRELGK